MGHKVAYYGHDRAAGMPNDISRKIIEAFQGVYTDRRQFACRNLPAEKVPGHHRSTAELC